MTVRTNHKAITFTRPFSLSGIDEAQLAGTYTVETHEELLPGLSFPAWRRIATLIFLPSRPGGAFVERVVTIDPLELEAAQEKDAASANRLGADDEPAPTERPEDPDVMTACAGRVGHAER